MLVGHGAEWFGDESGDQSWPQSRAAGHRCRDRVEEVSQHNRDIVRIAKLALLHDPAEQPFQVVVVSLSVPQRGAQRTERRRGHDRGVLRQRSAQARGRATGFRDTGLRPRTTPKPQVARSRRLPLTAQGKNVPPRLRHVSATRFMVNSNYTDVGSDTGSTGQTERRKGGGKGGGREGSEEQEGKREARGGESRAGMRRRRRSTQDTRAAGQRHPRPWVPSGVTPKPQVTRSG